MLYQCCLQMQMLFFQMPCATLQSKSRNPPLTSSRTIQHFTGTHIFEKQDPVMASSKSCITMIQRVPVKLNSKAQIPEHQQNTKARARHPDAQDQTPPLNWVDVKELSLSYHATGTYYMMRFPHNGNSF